EIAQLKVLKKARKTDKSKTSYARMIVGLFDYLPYLVWQGKEIHFAPTAEGDVQFYVYKKDGSIQILPLSQDKLAQAIKDGDVEVKVGVIELNSGFGLVRPHQKMLEKFGMDRGELVGKVWRNMAKRGYGYLEKIGRAGNIRTLRGPISQPAAGTTATLVDAAEKALLEDVQSRSGKEYVDADDLSISLGSYVKSRLEGQFEDTLPEMLNNPIARARVISVGVGILRKEMKDLQKKLRDMYGAANPGLSFPLAFRAEWSDYFMGRVAEIAVERIENPSSRIVRVYEDYDRLSVDDFERIVGDRSNLAVLSGTLDGFMDALYALKEDSAAYDEQTRGRPNRNVLGILWDQGWVERRQDKLVVKRAIVYDEISQTFKEVCFPMPLTLDSSKDVAMTTNIPKEAEMDVAEKISDDIELCGIPHVNPWKAAQRVYDKKKAYKAMQGKVAMPDTVEVLRDELENLQAIEEKLKKFQKEGAPGIDVIVKPNEGTESEDARHFSGIKSARDHVLKLLRGGKDVLLQSQEGTARYYNQSEDTRGRRRLVLRVNVAWDGTGFAADSGYAQVAQIPSEAVVSRAKGAQILDINEALNNLWYKDARGRWTRLELSSQHVAEIKKAAKDAVKASGEDLSLDDVLKFAGVDITLNISQDEEGNTVVTPVVLEVNARPAGLSNSRPILEPGQQPDDVPRVAQSLFKGLNAQAGHTIAEWMDIVRFDEQSGFRQTLINRYGDGEKVLAKAKRKYLNALKKAKKSGIYDLNKPVVLTAAPGRVRVYGGHPDAPGINVDAVSMALEEEILMVVQRSDDDIVMLESAERGSRSFSIADLDARPIDEKGIRLWIKDFLSWDKWVRAMMKKGIIPKKIDRKKEWETFAKAVMAYYQGKFPDKEFSGLRVYIPETDLPVGGFSSSSAAVMGLNYAIDRLFGLNQSLQGLIDNGFCERTYFGQACGIGDHAVIAYGERNAIIDMRCAPEVPRKTVSFPEDISILMFDSAIDREMDMREISEKFRKEFKDEMGDANIVNRRSGASSALAALYVRQLFLNNPEYGEEYEREMTHYERNEKQPTPDPENIVGFLRELLPGGRLADRIDEKELYKIIKEIPDERVSREDLGKFMPGFTTQMRDIFSNHPEPAGGYRLREAAIYALSEGERIRLFVEACNNNYVGMIMELQRRGHDGDRVTRHRIKLDDNDNVEGEPEEIGFDPNIHDDELGALIAGYDTLPPEQREPLCKRAGTFERSLERLDYFCDLVDAWAEKHKVHAAARISAAGLGGVISVFCEDKHKEALKLFLEKNYYDKYDYVFKDGTTVNEYRPGQGAQVIAGDFLCPKDITPQPQRVRGDRGKKARLQQI
ncbi:MAG: hypothetical protein ABH825_00660, partial [Candidatus Omnitrophota bacterium]